MATNMGGGHGLSWPRGLTPYPATYRHPPGSPEALRRDAIAEIDRSFTRTTDDLGWMDDAACLGADPEAWFPEAGQNTDNIMAKKICRSCPVRAQCREFGRNQGYGLYGGKARDARRAVEQETG